MPEKGLHLTKSDIIEVLIHTGLRNDIGDNFCRERIDENAVRVTFMNWNSVLQEKIPQSEELREVIRQFVEERIQIIARAKFETAVIEFK